ncbi:PQQ-binding-like beta-propeller repeat protein [Haladaptatus cibarius]|uniref:PQQ-binding-like beta-propeller repeat protein n=1 Tax=Haladaptatus cibarius TaxID=453847 RepID=UPI0006784F7A|nr:PQQ-binding-like beta-propeller repeat protein [Haladaptatus cibarius]
MNGTHRRKFLKTAGVLGAMATVGTGFALSATDTDESDSSWPTRRGNAGRTGATADRGPDSSVTTKWSFDMGGGMYANEPIVGNDIIYLAVATANTPSTSEGYVAAYDSAGNEIWKRGGISRPGTPTLGDGAIYFDTFGAEDADSTGFFALDSETGETKWHKPSSSGFGGALVADGGLYCTVAGDACEIDPETGDVVWKTQNVGGATCYADGTLFYGDGIALSAKDGSVLWDVSGDEDRLQTVSGGQVYSVKSDRDTGTEVRARSADDGTVLWSQSLGIEGYWWGAQLTAADGRVFFRVDNTVRALDAKTGEEAWVYEANAELAGDLTVANDALYVGGRTTPEPDVGIALIIAIDTASGERKWHHSFGAWEFDEIGPAAGTPVIANGKVYTATFPLRSTIDWMYTEYADFHVLGAAESNETTSQSTETTDEETTATTEGMESETTTTDDGTTKTTTTTDDGTTTDGTTSETPAETTTSERTVTETTETTQTTTIQTKGTTTFESPGDEDSTTTTTTDGQPGFGILTTIGGLAGVGAYLRRRVEREE